MSDATPPDLIAKRDELDRIVATLDVHFDVDMSSALLNRTADEWWDLYGDISSPILATAAESYLRNGQGFPSIGTFNAYIECAAEYHQLQAAAGGGCKCDNGWAPAPAVMRGRVVYRDNVRPCPACRPEQAELWRTQWAPQARRNVPIQPDAVMPFNPTEKLRECKARVADASAPHWTGEVAS